MEGRRQRGTRQTRDAPVEIDRDAVKIRKSTRQDRPSRGQGLVDHMRAEYPEVLPGHVRAALGSDEPNRRFDTVVMGRATYEPALAIGITSPYPHLRQYVVSGTLGAGPDPAVTVVADDPVATVRELKAEDGLDIYLAGGGRLAGALLDEIDELVVKQYPVVAGAGVPLFSADFVPVDLRPVAAVDIDGVRVTTYERVRGD